MPMNQNTRFDSTKETERSLSIPDMPQTQYLHDTNQDMLIDEL